MQGLMQQSALTVHCRLQTCWVAVSLSLVTRPPPCAVAVALSIGFSVELIGSTGLGKRSRVTVKGKSCVQRVVTPSL